MPDDIFEILVIAAEKLTYMANGDESHQKLSNEGDASGPRSNVYINPNLARAGKRKVVYSKHATIWVWAAYDGQVGPVALMLATDAAEAKAYKQGTAASTSTAPCTANSTTDAVSDSTQCFANRRGIRVRPDWMCGVPRVQGKFGCKETQIFEPIFMLNESGGTTGDSLEEMFELGVLPCYPNLSPKFEYDAEGSIVKAPLHFQLDAGPGRYAESTLAWRASMWERGLALFPGLLNGTASNQVLDDLFGVYKSGCSDVTDIIISERITANQKDSTVKVNLDFCDLGRIINGRPQDPVHLRSFERSFTPEKIKASTEKLGLAPINLKRALSHPRVRDDSSDGSRNSVAVQLIERNKATLLEVAAAGFDSTVLTVPLVKEKQSNPAFVAPPAAWEDRWKAVKAAGASAGAHWVAVGPRAFNAPDVVLPAMERVQDRINASQEKAQQKEETLRELQEAAVEICDECGGAFDELTAADAKTVVSFIFKAKKMKGVGQHTANKQAAVDYLLELDMDDIQVLLDAEYASTALVPVAIAVPADSDDDQPLLQLTDASRPAFDHALLPKGMSPKVAPEWLAAAVESASEFAEQLVGQQLMYRWPTRIGGWLHGTVSAVNRDPKELVGEIMANFVVHYTADSASAHHVLTLKSYAKSGKSPVDSWVLLEGSAVA